MGSLTYGNIDVAKKYRHHLERVFGDLLLEKWVDCEYLVKDRVGEDLFIQLKEKYEQYLSTYSQEEDIEKKLIISDDVIINVLGIYPLSVLSKIPQAYQMYYPICTEEEIKRISFPKNTDDILLTVRGEAVANNVRLHRVLLAKYNNNPKKWTLSSYFSEGEFKHFLEYLTPNERSKCNITAGFAFTKEPNGSCVKSKFGNYIVISEALRYFLYFMNLFHLGEGLSLRDRMTSLLIAVRVMLYIEQLDFDLDPRGIIPRKLEKQVRKVTQDQIQFVIGHEYFHHIFGHLDGKVVTRVNLLPVESAETVTVYNYSQLKELEVDFASIHRPNYSKTYRSDLVNAAFLFFMSLDLYRCVKEYCFPSIDHFKTHPDPLDRLWTLRSKISPKFGMSVDEINGFLATNMTVKKHLQEEWLPLNMDDFETQRSYYLSSYVPGAALDRIHY